MFGCPQNQCRGRHPGNKIQRIVPQQDALPLHGRYTSVVLKTKQHQGFRALLKATLLV